MEFTNRTVLITGAAGNLGRAVASAFGERGASLVLDGRFSTGMLLAFVAYKRQLAMRVSALIDKLFEVRLLELHCERLGDIVLTPPAEPANAPGRLLSTRAGAAVPAQ